ncbi:enoyl-CoA hydratase-related protein [Isoptericola variabilis]|uniref:Formyl transferase domain protein n=1 Tax=Isoptericola variabilis (strain 225) TaxID=743718 RepID=F6FU29_ISOV2|nr:enoyl-CoA hydratase-related protein [Isoptericola variabilis]AEG43225.1 formyl transferase domain protein [Isoptericola variabilis 225]TWH35160.1 putative two-component system hydrogenase maturation factor HypX/HoxX [Isoptericola variabilis J7]
MRILLLVSAFNGLTQRVWCHLTGAGHDVGVELAPVFATPEDLVAAVEDIAPDLILAPFLKHRVPEQVWRRWTTVVVHPGPVGDRGPSSLDHAILDGRERWGVTALSAVEEMDAGPVWATSTFAMPAVPLAKSALYNGPVADAAMRCVDEVLRKVAAGEGPTPADDLPREVAGTGELPLLRRAAFELDWSLPAADLARRVAAADGAPGAPATVGGRRVCLFDAVATAQDLGGTPGAVVGHDGDAVAFATGDGVLWVGYAAELAERRGPKLPARLVLDPQRRSPYREAPEQLAEAVYERDGDVGYLTFRSYNGAMHTEQCLRLAAAVEKALTEDTRVLVLRGTEHTFSNGIHLGMIDAAEDPAAEAWANIQAIDDLCEAIARAEQTTVAAITANAGAGGVMAALCADVVVARDGVVLNPYYDMGIYGSELHTWALPARVGAETADALLQDKLPVGATRARELGLVDAVGPRDPEAFAAWLAERAREGGSGDARREGLGADAAGRPLSYYRTVELAEMARDLFDDRNGFAGRRRDFLRKAAPTETPERLRFPRA